jgi:hypothetical protein
MLGPPPSRWLVKSGKRPHDIGIRDIRLLFHQRRIFLEGRPDLTNHRLGSEYCMSAIWAPVIAALGASLLTGFFTFGLEWWREWKAAKSALAERRSRAYSKLLVESTSILQLVSNMHIAMEARSGLREGINVMTGKLKPLDPLEFARWLGAESQPLFEAWSEVWAVGTKEAIAEANDLVAKCADVMGAGT